MKPDTTALNRWCDDTITLMLELGRGASMPAAVALASALAATLSSPEGTDWLAVLRRLEAWEIAVELPATARRPATELRRLLRGFSC